MSARPQADVDIPDPAGHPRLLVTDADLARLKELVAGDPLAAAWYRGMRAEALAMLEEPVSRYEIPDGKRLLRTSRRVLRRARYLGLVYRLEGDDALARRLWQELEAAAGFPDWNPSHFLDTAEMTHAFAIGYDWLHEAWSDAQRAALREALVTHSLAPGVAAYGQARPRHTWWVQATHNWNIVCNAGLGLGALALLDEEPELCRRVVQGGLASMPLALASFAPDGAWHEGPNYWSYTVRYLVPYLAALESALGTDFGLAESEGLERTGDFPLHVTGPAGRAFNYGDASGAPPRQGELHWLARRFDRPAWAAWHADQVGEAGDDRSLIWYDPQVVAAGRRRPLPRDRHFRGVEVVAMRQSWGDPGALFVALKGGDNRANHGDLDLGSFVLESGGVRWAVELPADNYNLPGYFDVSGGGRWRFYRTRAEGQNTLVINPGEGPDQHPRAEAPVVSFVQAEEQALAVVELSAAYRHHGARSVRRGFALCAGRSQALVQDEVTLAAAGDLHWFLHTRARVLVAEGGRRALLVQDGRGLWVEVLASDGAALTVEAARPLATSPTVEGQAANEGFRKLAVRLNGVSEVRLAVRMVPVPAEVRLAAGDDGGAGESGAALLAAQSQRLAPRPAIVPLEAWQNGLPMS